VTHITESEESGVLSAGPCGIVPKAFGGGDREGGEGEGEGEE